MGFFKRTHGNIKAVMERDPAARHSLEVILCYPGVWALIFIHCRILYIRLI